MTKRNYEQTRISSRLREYAVLYVFILLAGAASLVLMNMLVFPVVLSAVKKPVLFTAVVKYILLGLIIAYFLFKGWRALQMFRSSKNGFFKALHSSLVQKGSSCAFGFIVVVSGAILAAGIFFLLKYNYYLLYEIMN